MYVHLNSVPLHGKVFCKTVRIAQDFPMFPKEQENYNHSRGWEIDTLIHHKLSKTMQQQTGRESPLRFLFLCWFFLTRLSSQSYNQNP